MKSRESYNLPESCTLAKFFSFKKAPNPSSINWENRAASIKKEWKKKSIVILIKLVAYEVVCLLVIFTLGALIKRTVFEYYFSNQCNDINNMMQFDSNYLMWANIDKAYRQDNSMTGIYQCFCQEEYGTLFGPLKQSTCIRFAYGALFGGHIAVIPFGISIGILNNIGATIVINQMPQIGFHSLQKQRQIIFLSIFVMSYLNSSLFLVWINTENSLTPISVSSHLSAAWIQTFGMMIFSGTLTTNLCPYIGVIFDIISVRYLRKKERSQ